MLCCLISSSDFNDDFLELKYSLINSSEEIKIDKTFKIDLSNQDVTYFKFSQHQFSDGRLLNCIGEILDDFARSKYILGKASFENYFLKINQLKNISEKFKSKYVRFNEIFKKVANLKDILL